jgi:hypothetical protein
MKHSILLITTLALCAAASAGAATSDNESQLRKLDKVITLKEHYLEQKEQSLNNLKVRLGGTSDKRQKYLLCDSLFRGYLHHQADSAMVYVERKQALSAQIDDADMADEIVINRAEVLGVTGMYIEAFNNLTTLRADRLSPANRVYYYKTCRACYGWLTDYSQSESPKELYMQRTNEYRDSIILAMEPGMERDVVWAEKMLLNGDSEIALNKLLCAKDTAESDPSCAAQLKAYIYFTLSEVYKSRGDREREVYYLTLTSISDLESSTREYASLQKLAQLMHEAGEVKRAYSYLSRSMEDAVACNARLRFIEVSQIFPIIDKSYKMEEERDRHRMLTFTIVLGVLGAMLIVLIFFLMKWMNRLKAIRRYLSETNRRMHDINKKLEETGKIKDMYIARYLDRCAGYLNKLDTYRHSLVKFAMASRVDELFKAIKSDEFISEERRNFYNEFDKSFLDLFPDFVSAFNELLVEEARIYPKPGELLTTELRIFALIRLGVTDSNRIAGFLGYSLTTIYNYRSKMRNRALGSKEQFEQNVMNLFNSSL